MEQDSNYAATLVDANGVWTELYFTPPYGRCARKDCGCLRFELTPDQFAPANPTCSGCSHHANFHALGSEADRTFGLRRRQILLDVWLKSKNAQSTAHQAPLCGTFKIDGRRALSDFSRGQIADKETSKAETPASSPVTNGRPNRDNEEDLASSDGKYLPKREAGHVYHDMAVLETLPHMTQNVVSFSSRMTHASDDPTKERLDLALDSTKKSIKPLLSQQRLTGHTEEQIGTPAAVCENKSNSELCVADTTTEHHELRASRTVGQPPCPTASSIANLTLRDTQHIDTAMENLNLHEPEPQNHQVSHTGRTQHNHLNPSPTNMDGYTMQRRMAKEQTFRNEDALELLEPDSRSRVQDTARDKQAGKPDTAKAHTRTSPSVEDSMFKLTFPESHLIEPRTPENPKTWHTSNNIDPIDARDHTSTKPTAMLHSFATGSSQPASGTASGAKESKPLFEVWLPGQTERRSSSSADGPVKYVPWWMEESSPSAETSPAETFPTGLQASSEETDFERSGSDYRQTARDQTYQDECTSALNQPERHFANVSNLQKQATKTLSRTEYYARYGIWPPETNAQRDQRRKRSKMKSETGPKQVNSSSISRFSSKTRSISPHLKRGKTHTTSLKSHAFHPKSPSDQSTTPSQQGNKETRRRAERRQRARIRAEAESTPKRKDYTSAESLRSPSTIADNKTYHLDTFSEFEEMPLIDL